MKKQKWFTPIYQRTFDKEPLVFNDYLINEYGQVFTRIRNKRLSPTTDKSNYYILGLKLGDEKIYCSVARLVGHTFIPNPDRLSKPIINHIDGNIHNNHKSNLEWVSHKENTQKYHDLKKSGGKNEDVYDKSYYTEVKNQLNIFDELNE
tara:strand:+ start:665 stop:1111 length:447 start_codon:yes stop_codon:yes gene_type:complete